MDLGDGLQQVFCRISMSGNVAILFLWHILHLIISILYFVRGIINTVESYFISIGLVKTCKSLNLGQLQYLGVVVDSEEARQTSRVIELLEWLASIGVKKVCLYDREGVLKKSKEVFIERFSPAKLSDEALQTDPLLNQKHMALEFVSISDGKEAVAKAANLLFKMYYLDGNQDKPILTETHLTEALRTIGYGAPDPDLILIYGPARCHLGFPAWRIRYTEIVHMGPLKFMKYGLILKAIHKFTKVKQNYGS